MVRYLHSLLLCVFIISGVKLTAQQDVQFTQFWNNKTIYNPGAAGIDDAINLTAFYRNQWVGIPGHPVSQSISADMPLYRISSGAGIYFMNDELGQERNMTFMLSYAYIKEFNNSRVSFGINAGVLQKSLDGTKLRAPQGQYGEQLPVDHNDDLLPSSKVSSMTPDMGLGIFFKNRSLGAGVSVNHLLEPQLTLDYPNGSTDFSYRRHFTALATYNIDVSRRISLQPSILGRSDLVLHQVDLNMLVIYNDFIWTGVSFRGYNNLSKDAVMGSIGMNVTDDLKFGYSYDFTLSALQQVNSGTHEVFVNYRIPLQRVSKGKIINNPRYLYY